MDEIRADPMLNGYVGADPPAWWSKYSDAVKKGYEEYYKPKLTEAVAIQSVSPEEKQRDKVIEMGTRLGKWLEDLGAKVELLSSSTTVPKLPPVVLARYPAKVDGGKKTVLIYGHYDVMAAENPESWVTKAPFKLTLKDKKLYGRGSTDGKGPVLGWLAMIRAFQEAKIDVPVSIVFCFEGMEESDSEGTDDVIQGQGKSYFEKIVAGCISDNYWLTTRTPYRTYGIRGINTFKIVVSGPKQDLHSGLYGGTVYEPLADLIILLSKIVDSQGKISIPGVEEDIAPLSKQEEELYKKLDFKMQDIYDVIDSETTISNYPLKTIIARFRYPSLSIHGIEGAYSDTGFKTVIPAKVIGKFSIRTAPNQDKEKINDYVNKYINAEFKKLNSKNKLQVVRSGSGSCWIASSKQGSLPTDHPNFHAAADATRLAYALNKDPDFPREGGSIPITLSIQKAIRNDKSIVLLPVGKSDGNAHSTNENIGVDNLINGTKLFNAYLYYFSKA